MNDETQQPYTKHDQSINPSEGDTRTPFSCPSPGLSRRIPLWPDLWSLWEVYRQITALHRAPRHILTISDLHLHVVACSGIFPDLCRRGHVRKIIGLIRTSAKKLLARKLTADYSMNVDLDAPIGSSIRVPSSRPSHQLNIPGILLNRNLWVSALLNRYMGSPDARTVAYDFNTQPALPILSETCSYFRSKTQPYAGR